jgi:hypothetical protein
VLLARCLFKVADLHKLNLGNEGYILTKVCRRLSRNMSGARQASSDPLAYAKEALSGVSGCGAAVAADGSTSISIKSAAALALAPTAEGAAAPLGDDWARATYEPMSAAEAAAVPSTAEVAANAALNLQGCEDAVSVVHAKRLSGGGANIKLMCNLKAIKEETDKPVHVISTETAVTEVYGDGLTIIRSAQSCKRVRGGHALPDYASWLLVLLILYGLPDAAAALHVWSRWQLLVLSRCAACIHCWPCSSAVSSVIDPLLCPLSCVLWHCSCKASHRCAPPLR